MQNMPKESSSKLEALQEDNFRQEYDHEEKKNKNGTDCGAWSFQRAACTAGILVFRHLQ